MWSFFKRSVSGDESKKPSVADEIQKKLDGLDWSHTTFDVNAIVTIMNAISDSDLGMDDEARLLDSLLKKISWGERSALSAADIEMLIRAISDTNVGSDDEVILISDLLDKCFPQSDNKPTLPLDNSPIPDNVIPPDPVFLQKMGFKMVDFRRPVNGDFFVSVGSTISTDYEAVNKFQLAGKRWIVKPILAEEASPSQPELPVENV